MSGAGHGYRFDWSVSYWLDMKSSHALFSESAVLLCYAFFFQNMLYTSEVSREVFFSTYFVQFVGISFN